MSELENPLNDSFSDPPGDGPDGNGGYAPVRPDLAADAAASAVARAAADPSKDPLSDPSTDPSSDPSTDLSSDAELVKAFVQSKSERAFAQIVARHGAAVYASARRQLGDASLADDVTQAVFILLTRRAGSIGRPELLGGWLMKTTRYCVLNVRRSQKRRTEHEARAAEASAREAAHSVPARSAEDTSAELLPVIDEALHQLGPRDRAIITLGVLESRPQVEIARTLNLSPDAVRKRLPRAIEKIRRELSRLGVAVSAEGMALALQPLAVQNFALPQGLLGRVMASHSAAHTGAHAGAGSAAHVIAGSVSRQLTIKAASIVATAVTGLALWGGGAGLWLGYFRSSPPHSPARAAAPAGPTVYAFNPADPAQGWSLGRSLGSSPPPTALTPKGRQPFLGPFANQNVSLRLKDLPKHDFVRIRADLYVMNTWDGVGRLDANLTPAGPDFWSLRLDDRPALIRSTFSATPDDPGFAFSCKLQTFPAVIPGPPQPAGTGAYLVNGLGYVFAFSPTVHFPMDGAYHLDLTLPHSAAAMTLTVGGDGLGNIGDESWGITNVKVDAVAAADVAKPTGDEIQTAWRATTGPDPVAASAAFWTLVAGGDATVAFLQRQAVPAPCNSADVKRRLSYWSDPDAETAFAARQDLIAMGPAVESLLPPDHADAKLDTSAVAGTFADATADENPAARDVLERIDLRPILDPAARAAAAQAKLLSAIHTPVATAALRIWLDAGPVWQPDALRRFETAYHLPPGVNVRHVTPADPADRAAYLHERRTIVAGAHLGKSYVQDAADADNSLGNSPDNSPGAVSGDDSATIAGSPAAQANADARGDTGSSFGRVFVLADETPNYWTPAFGLFDPGTPGWARAGQVAPVRQLLNHLRRTHTGDWEPVQIDPAVLDLPTRDHWHGDWLVRREPSSQADQLTELAAALSGLSGKTVTAAAADLPQLASVLVGTPSLAGAVPAPAASPTAASVTALPVIQSPAFEPRSTLPAALESTAASDTVPPTIDLYTDAADLAAAPAVREIVSLRNLPVYLARYGRRVAWQTPPAGDAHVELRFHPAALIAVLPEDAAAPRNAALADAIVNHLAVQLGVTVRTEAHPRPGYRLGVAP